jgi:hypothetical protein
MIRVHFSVKRKLNTDKAITGKIVSIGLHFIEQPNVKEGIIRLSNLRDDKFKRLKHNQTVLTADGLGVIKDPDIKKDEQGNPILPMGVNVRVRNLNKNKIFYNLSNLKVIDIIENSTGFKYPALETDYPYLLLDDLPITFVVSKTNVAMLSIASRRKLENIKMFTKKANGIQLLNNLINKGIWTPIGK